MSCTQIRAVIQCQDNAYCQRCRTRSSVRRSKSSTFGSRTQESLSRKRHVKSNLCIVAYRAEKHGGVHSGTMWAYVQWVSFPCLFGRSATIISCLCLSSRGHCGAPHKVQHKYNTEGRPGGQPLAVRGIRVGRGHGLQIQPRDSKHACTKQWWLARWLARWLGGRPAGRNPPPPPPPPPCWRSSNNQLLLVCPNNVLPVAHWVKLKANVFANWGNQQSKVAHKWAGWLHNTCHLGGPHRFRTGGRIRSGPQVGPVAT